MMLLRMRHLRRPKFLALLLGLALALRVFHLLWSAGLFKRVVRDVPYLLRPLWDRAPRFRVLPFRGFDGANHSCARHGFRARRHAGNQPAVRIFDCFLFHSELEMLELRLHELAPAVDFFVLVESTRTFTGQRKPLYYERSKHEPRFARYRKQIIHIVMGERELAPISQRTAAGRGQSRDQRYDAMGREKAQRRFIMRGLVRQGVFIARGDVVLLSDVDELPRRGVAQLLLHCHGFPAVLHLQLRRFAFSFAFADGESSDTHSSARTYDPRVPRLSHLLFVHRHTEVARGAGLHLLGGAGWHCSFCFRSIEEFLDKMGAYSHAERGGSATSVFRTPAHVQRAVCEGRDLYDMLPEAYTFRDLFARWGRLPPRATRDLPMLLRRQQEQKHVAKRFQFLLPGHCLRPRYRNQNDQDQNQELADQHSAAA